MKTKYRIFSGLLFILFIHTTISLSILYAEGTAETALIPPNARLASLGGFHPALTDDVWTIFTNPAGFHSPDSDILISEVTLGLTGPIFNIISAIISGGDIEENSELLAELTGIYADMELLGPVSFAYVGDGLGVGFFQWTDVEFDSKGSLSMSAALLSNLLITGGYAFRIPLPAENNIDIGLQLKALVRGYTETTGTTLEIFSDTIEDPLQLLYMGDFVLSIGGGIDCGILYSLRDVFSFGITARNCYTPTRRNTYDSLDVFLGNEEGTPEESTGYVPLDLSTGIKFSPPLGYLSRFFSDLTLYLDYVDILDMATHPDTATHWFLHFGFGIELTMLDILKVRGGFSEGLFAAGLGLDLTLFDLSVSMFGSELSSEPSLRPAYNIILGIQFKL